METKEHASRYLILSENQYTLPNGAVGRLLYATRTATLLFVDEPSAQALISGNVSGIAEDARPVLRDCEALIPVDRNEQQTIVDRMRSSSQNSARLRYVILPTAYCNMACDYCGQSHTRGSLSIEHRDSLRDRVVQAISRPSTQ